MFEFLYNLISKSVIVLILSMISVNFLPKQLFSDFPFEPRSLEAPKYETVIPKDWNNKLSDAGQPEYIQLNNILGPESIAISPTNDKLLYTGLADGRLVELDAGNNYKLRLVLRFHHSPKCKDNIPYHGTHCGRFLQLRFQNTTLYALDANTGLYKIDVKSGKKMLIGPFFKIQPTNLFNSFAFDPKDPNIVYITISSTRWDLTQIVWSIVELEASGQVIAIDVRTTKQVIIMDKLMTPNGIDVDAKRDELIFSETAKSRVNSLCLKEIRQMFHKTEDGQKISAGGVKLTELIPLLPGMPDNIHIQGDLAYIALPFVRINGSELIDKLSDAPMLRKSFGRIIFGIGKILEYVCEKLYHHPLLETAYHELKSGHFNYRITQSDKSAIVLYNLAAGSSKILGSDTFGFISEAVPDGKGNLLLGSFRSPFIVKTKLV